MLVETQIQKTRLKIRTIILESDRMDGPYRTGQSDGLEKKNRTESIKLGLPSNRVNEI